MASLVSIKPAASVVSDVSESVVCVRWRVCCGRLGGSGVRSCAVESNLDAGRA